MNGEHYYATPIGVHGVTLRCHVPGFAAETIVCEYQVADKQAFWQAWRVLGGDQQNLVWEGGAKFEPPMTVPFERPRSWFQRLIDYLFPWTVDSEN